MTPPSFYGRYTQYVIEAETLLEGKRALHHTEHRVTDFREFHAAVRPSLPSLAANFPLPKMGLRVTTPSKTVKEERMVALQLYLRTLIEVADSLAEQKKEAAHGFRQSGPRPCRRRRRTPTTQAGRERGRARELGRPREVVERGVCGSLAAFAS